MKTKFLLVPAVVVGMLMTSCSKKPSEQTMKAVTDFESSWTSLGEQATAWSGELKGSVDKCTEQCAKMDKSMGSMASAAADMKAKYNEMAAGCKNDKAAFEAMGTEWEAFKTTWEADTKAFAEWKEKVNKGEGTDEEATKALASYQTKMDEAKAKIEGWNTAFAAAKETCMKNTDACANMEKMMTEKPMPEKKAKGKKK